MGQNAHRNILPVNTMGVLPHTGVNSKIYKKKKFWMCRSNETRACLSIANTLCHKHALAEEKDSNNKRTVR